MLGLRHCYKRSATQHFGHTNSLLSRIRRVSLIRLAEYTENFVFWEIRSRGLPGDAWLFLAWSPITGFLVVISSWEQCTNLNDWLHRSSTLAITQSANHRTHESCRAYHIVKPLANEKFLWQINDHSPWWHSKFKSESSGDSSNFSWDRYSIYTFTSFWI